MEEGPKIFSTAKRKLGAMALYMRQGDEADENQLDRETAAMAMDQQQKQLTEVVMSRKEIAAAAKVPIPKATRPTNSGGQPSRPKSPAPTPFPPVARMRTASDSGREVLDNPTTKSTIWEDSTVASMFDESNSRGSVERLKGYHTRRISENTIQQRTSQFEQRNSRARGEDHHHNNNHHHHQNNGGPLIVGENGLSVRATNGTAARGSGHGVSAGGEAGDRVNTPRPVDAGTFPDERGYDTTPTKPHQIRPKKLAAPHRDRASRRQSVAAESLLDFDSINVSPDLSSDGGGAGNHGFVDVRREDILRDERAHDEDQAHEFQRKHSMVLGKGPAPPLADEASWMAKRTPSGSEAAMSDDHNNNNKEALERTPRASRRQLSRSRLPQEGAVLRNAFPHHHHHHHHSHHNSNSNSNNANPNTRSSQHYPPLHQPQQQLKPIIGMPPKKRPLNLGLDYDDAELHEMAYAELKDQDFDYNPQAAASIQAATLPSGDSLTDKLEYYRKKDGTAQHQFFTQISVEDWEASGDWFLEQFGNVVQNLKAARTARRQVVAHFEAELAQREEAVRGKVDGIARRLKGLKQEGQMMMQGKSEEEEDV